jgi:thiol:disulfide interchange protein DsbD
MLVGIAAAAWAEDPELLPADEAFRYSARLIDYNQIEVRYQIAPGYYLYRDKFSFDATPAAVTTSGPRLPPGTLKNDKFFGDVEIYRGDLHFVVPFEAGAQPPSQIILKSTSQGCADVGVCYPPQEQQVAINLAAPASVSSVSDGAARFVQPAPENSAWVSPTPVKQPAPAAGSGVLITSALGVLLIFGGIVGSVVFIRRRRFPPKLPTSLDRTDGADGA